MSYPQVGFAVASYLFAYQDTRLEGFMNAFIFQAAGSLTMFYMS